MTGQTDPNDYTNIMGPAVGSNIRMSSLSDAGLDATTLQLTTPALSGLGHPTTADDCRPTNLGLTPVDVISCGGPMSTDRAGKERLMPPSIGAYEP